MREKWIKISIDKKGKVSFTVEGVKGADCLNETKFLEEALGGAVLSREMTGEYYEEAQAESTVTTQND
jgi:hypothetical protein